MEYPVPEVPRGSTFLYRSLPMAGSPAVHTADALPALPLARAAAAREHRDACAVLAVFLPQRPGARAAAVRPTGAVRSVVQLLASWSCSVLMTAPRNCTTQLPL
eukprot:SAG31_NODE_1666_length_7581_cov_2.398022_1_plen_104_part_00